MGRAAHAPRPPSLQYVRMSGGDGPCDGRLAVALSYRGGVARLALAGELDLACVPRFDALVASAFVMADRCLIDLSELEFVDSSGVRALIRARRRAAETGATLELANAPPAIARVLTQAGVEHVPGEA
jgi:anti-sigma B factor antagonist